MYYGLDYVGRLWGRVDGLGRLLPTLIVSQAGELSIKSRVMKRLPLPHKHVTPISNEKSASAMCAGEYFS